MKRALLSLVAALLATTTLAQGPPDPEVLREAALQALREGGTSWPDVPRLQGTLAVLARDLRALSPALLPSAAAAIAAQGPRAAFEALAGALGGGLGRDAFLLLELRRLGPRLAVPPSEAALRALVEALGSGEPAVVVLGASLVAQLQHTSAVPALIEALDRTDANAGRAVREALSALTRVDLGTDAALWHDWYDAQLRWLEREAPAAASELEQAPSEAASRALQRLSGRRVFRDEVARALVAGLGRPEPVLVKTTCAALGELGSWSAVPELLNTLERGAPEARAAAHAALARITRLDLPADAATWRFRIRHLEPNR